MPEDPALGALIKAAERDLLIILDAVFGGVWLLLSTWKSGIADRK